MTFSKSCKSTWKLLNSILIIIINFKWILDGGYSIEGIIRIKILEI